MFFKFAPKPISAISLRFPLAIVSADVAGYSRLLGRDESGTLAALKSLRQAVVDPVIASQGGRIVKTTGDGLLLEFPSVVNAMRCAVEVHTAIRRHERREHSALYRRVVACKDHHLLFVKDKDGKTIELLRISVEIEKVQAHTGM